MSHHELPQPLFFKEENFRFIWKVLETFFSNFLQDVAVKKNQYKIKQTYNFEQPYNRWTSTLINRNVHETISDLAVWKDFSIWLKKYIYISKEILPFDF